MKNLKNVLVKIIVLAVVWPVAMLLWSWTTLLVMALKAITKPIEWTKEMLGLMSLPGDW